MNTVSSKVGNKIREHRQRLGISIETLALSAEITPNFLGDVERGKKKPSLDTLERLLNALNLSFEEFFSYEAEFTPRKDRSKSEKIIADISGFSDEELMIIHNIIRQLIRFKKT
jgi:transcriptional regulator with XRE-family HTH domain